MTRSRPAPTPPRLPGRLRGRLVLTTALGGCLAAFATTAARAQDLPVVAPVGTLIGSPTGVTPGVATDAIGVTQTGTIIDWQSFNIGTGQTVTISDARTGPAAGSRMTMLNRVTGLLGIVPRSQIDGTLNGAANIAVYIVNPSGIVFGNNAVVNVGGLIASTLAISDTNFAAGNYIFADAGNTAGISVASSANLTSTGIAADQLGQVALIGARIDSAGTIAAAGDVALVAASDVTLTYDAANPLGFTVREGTSLGTVTTGGVTTSGPMVVSGTIGGRSALFVAATRQTVTDAVLDMSAAVTATTAVATDRGIVLIAGRDTAADARVTFAGGPGGAPLAANSGTVSLALGGAALNSGLTATGAGGAIRLASNGGIGAGSGAAPFASSLAASQAILATSLTGDVVLGSATGNSVGATATAGGVSLGTVVAGVGGTALNAGAGALAFATIESSGAISGAASGDITGTSAITTGGTMSLVSSGGTLAIGSASSAGAMTLNGAVATRVDTAVTNLAGSDLSVLGGAVSGVGVGTRATLTAGGALDITVTGPALLAAIRGATGVTVGAGAIDAGTATASAGALSLTAATGDLIIGSAAATSGSVGLSASGGVVTAAAVTGGTSVTVNGTGTTLGTVDALGTDLAIATSDPLGSLRLTDGFAAGATTLNAAGAAVIGRIDAGAIDIDAAGRLTATTLNAATALSGAGASVAIGSAIADTGALVLTSRAGGALQLGSGRSGTTTLLDAGESLSLTGTYRGGTSVTAQAAGAIDIATLESVNADVVVTAGGAVTAARLIAASDLTVTSNSFAIDSIEARTGSARLVAEGTTALLGSSTAIGSDLLVRGNTQASVTGSIAAGRDYTVEGASVLLGAGTPVTQTALRNIAITARDGSIVGQASLTLSAAGGGAGSLVLDATGGDILFAADTLVSGGVGRTGDIGIRLGSPGGTLRLGAVDARALLSVDPGGTVFSPLTTTGTIDLNGPVTLTRALQASTSGDILTRAITVSGVGEGLGLTTTGAGSDVTVRGRLQADGDVAVTARDGITFFGSGAAVSPTGAVTLIAQDGGIAGVGVVSAGARRHTGRDRSDAHVADVRHVRSRRGSVRQRLRGRAFDRDGDGGYGIDADRDGARLATGQRHSRHDRGPRQKRDDRCVARAWNVDRRFRHHDRQHHRCRTRVRDEHGRDPRHQCIGGHHRHAAADRCWRRAGVDGNASRRRLRRRRRIGDDRGRRSAERGVRRRHPPRNGDGARRGADDDRGESRADQRGGDRPSGRVGERGDDAEDDRQRRHRHDGTVGTWRRGDDRGGGRRAARQRRRDHRRHPDYRRGRGEWARPPCTRHRRPIADQLRWGKADRERRCRRFRVRDGATRRDHW